MATTQRSRPISAVLLFLLLGFQALSGLFGGGILVLDPTGGLLGLPVSVLDRSPFTDFLVPGLILFLVLGIAPAVIAVAIGRSTPDQPPFPSEPRRRICVR